MEEMHWNIHVCSECREEVLLDGRWDGKFGMK